MATVPMSTPLLSLGTLTSSSTEQGLEKLATVDGVDLRYKERNAVCPRIIIRVIKVILLLVCNSMKEDNQTTIAAMSGVREIHDHQATAKIRLRS